jgi:predicted permease
MAISVAVILNFLQTVAVIVITVLVGFLGARSDLLPPALMGGLGRVIGNVALPALLFKNMVSCGRIVDH